MSEIVNTFSSWFDRWKQQREIEGWRVEWNAERRSNICFAPNGSEAFEYGTEENEYYGAWAYLGHYLSKKNGA